MKNLTAQQLLILSESNLTSSHLLQLGSRYLTTSHRDITYDGQLWLSTTDILALPKKFNGYSSELTFQTLKIGLNQSVQNYTMALGNNQNLKCAIWLVLNDLVFQLFDGIVESAAVENRQVTVTARFLWQKYNNKKGRLHTDAAQQSLYPGDRGMEYASKFERNERSVKWGNS